MTLSLGRTGSQAEAVGSNVWNAQGPGRASDGKSDGPGEGREKTGVARRPFETPINPLAGETLDLAC